MRWAPCTVSFQACPQFFVTINFVSILDIFTIHKGQACLVLSLSPFLFKASSLISFLTFCDYFMFLSFLALPLVCTYWIGHPKKGKKGVSRIINHPVCCYHYGGLFGLKFCENNLLEISHKHNIWVSFHKQKIGHILYSQHCSMFSLVGCHLIHCSLIPFHPLSSGQADFSTACPEELCGGAEAAPKGGRQD